MNAVCTRHFLLAMIFMVLHGCSPSSQEKQTDAGLDLVDTLTIDSLSTESSKPESPRSTPRSVPDDAAAPDCMCQATAYIVTSPPQGISLVDEDHTTLQAVSFDEENEEFLEVVLQKSRDTLFQVQNLSNPFDPDVGYDEEVGGWVAGKHLTVFLPDAKGSISLFSAPDENADVAHQIETGGAYSIEVIACCEAWIYGIYRANAGQAFAGWFHPDDICSNPLTNC